MSKLFNRPIQVCGSPVMVGTMSITALDYDASNNVIKCSGSGAPTDRVAGFAKGCKYIRTDGGATTTWYVNEGSETSSSWSAVGAAGSTSFDGLTDTPANKTGAGDMIVKVNTGATALEFVALSGDISINASGVAAIGTGVIINTDVKSDAAIAYSKLAALTRGSILTGQTAGNVCTALDAKTDGYILVGNGTDLASVAVSGVITLANDGATAFAAGAIVNNDVNNAAAIAWSKLATSTDISTAGKVTDLTITSEAAGDILYFDGTNWKRLAKPGSSGYFLEGGVTPAWSLPSLASASSIQTGATLLDAGALDATIVFTQQTAGGASVVVPDFAAGAAFTFAFLSKAQTWSATQTIQYGLLKLGDNDNGQTLQILVNENMTGDKTLTIQPNDTNRSIHLHGNIDIAGDLTTTVGAVAFAADVGGSSSVTLPASGTLAIVGGALGACTVTTVNKLTLTQPANGSTITIVDGKTLTISKTIQFTSAGDNGVITLPNAAATLVATSDNLSVFAATTSAQLAGVISDETGSGLLVFGTSPALTTPTIATQVANGMRVAVASKSGDYSLLATDYLCEVDTTGGDVTITLPAIAAGNKGAMYTIKKQIAANNLVIAKTGADTIDGGGNVTLTTQYDKRTVVSDGTSNWIIVNAT